MKAFTSQHQFRFGGLDLTGRTDYDGARFTVMSEGATLGNPVPVDQEVDSLLFDGSFVATQSHGNRTIGLQVRIAAATSAVLAAAEALLFAQCSKQTTLVWVPPDGMGAPTTFKAFTSHLELQFSDKDEVRLLRAYNLSLICSPFGFSETETVMVAAAPAPVTPTTVVMSDGTSASGWSSPAGVAAAPSVSSGAILVRAYTAAALTTATDATFTFASTDFTTTNYLYVDVKPQANFREIQSSGSRSDGNSNARNMWLFVNGSTTPINQFSVTPNTDGSTRFAWVVTGTAVTSLRFLTGAQNGTPNAVYIDNVTRTNVAPGQSSTGRQSLRTVTIPGSARTAASVAIEHETAGLGNTIHYTSTALGVNGYQPNLSQYAVLSGGVTSTGDTSLVSGSYKRSSNAGSAGAKHMEFVVPVSVLPAGPYLMVARMKVTSGAPFVVSMTVSQVEGSTTYGSVTLPGSYSSAVNTAFAGFTTFGVATLPPMNVPDNSTGSVKIALDSATTTAGFSFDVDELWAFHMGDGSDITVVDCGTGTPALGTVHNRLRIDSPTPTNPRPALLVGTSADFSDAFDPGFPAVTARGVHPVAPPSSQAYVVTTGATFPTVTYRALPAWFTHAAS